MERIQEHSFAKWVKEFNPVVKELCRLGGEMEKNIKESEDVMRKEMETIDLGSADFDSRLLDTPKMVSLRERGAEIMHKIADGERSLPMSRTRYLKDY